MGGARQSFEPPEPRQRDASLAACGAREREPAGECVVHGLLSNRQRGRKTKPNDAKNASFG
jgi:hypothetical protein